MHRNSCGRAREAWGEIPKVEDRKEEKGSVEAETKQTLAWLGQLLCAGPTHECGDGEEGSMSPLYRHRN